MKYKIQVTEEDIMKGRPRAYCECPIALALIRVFGQSRVCGVTGQTIDIAECGWADDEIPLPSECAKFVNRFDTGELVGPFEFELETFTPAAP